MPNDSVLDKTASLAALRLGPKETVALRKDLNSIFLFLNKIASVATEGATPLTTPFAEQAPHRKDVLEKAPDPSLLLKNALVKENNLFKTPAMIQPKTP